MNAVDIAARALASRALEGQGKLAKPIGAAEVGTASGSTVQDELSVSRSAIEAISAIPGQRAHLSEGAASGSFVADAGVDAATVSADGGGRYIASAGAPWARQYPAGTGISPLWWPGSSPNGSSDNFAALEFALTAAEASGETLSLSGTHGGAQWTVGEPLEIGGVSPLLGNGSTLRNTNDTAVSVNDQLQGCILTGWTHPMFTDQLDFFAVDGFSVDGQAIDFATPADSDRFAIGDVAILRGALYRTSGDYKFFRSIYRRRIVDVSPGRIVFDRGVPEDILADTPVSVANADQGLEVQGRTFRITCGLRIHGPLALVSERGRPWLRGGVIDGVLRDLHFEGRDAVVVNALHHARIENVTFRCWRSALELAECSEGVLVDGFSGSLYDSPFEAAHTAALIALNENCKYTTLRNFRVHLGPRTAAAVGGAIVFSAGLGNSAEDWEIWAPAVTTALVSIENFAVPGMSNEGTSLRNLRVHGNQPSQYLKAHDNGGGLRRYTVENCLFWGSPTVSDGGIPRALYLDGESGTVRNVWCEKGGCTLAPSARGLVVEDNYLPDGFCNLTPALQAANPGIRNNRSDRSTRLNEAAALIPTDGAWITTSTPNAVYASMTIAPGDLRTGDRIFVKSLARSRGSGGGARKARLAILSNGVTTAVATITRTASLQDMGFDCELVAQANNLLSYRCNGTSSDISGAAMNLESSGLEIRVEYWTDGSANSEIIPYSCHIVPRVPGMEELPC